MKLVSESGVGTVAAGVAKAYADIVQISGCEGGTWAQLPQFHKKCRELLGDRACRNPGSPWIENGLREQDNRSG